MRLFLKPKNDSYWHELFKYELSTGLLIYRVRRGTRARVGWIAGCVLADGYIAVRHQGKGYKAHRIIWEMVNGPIPDGLEIDHVNRRRGR